MDVTGLAYAACLRISCLLKFKQNEEFALNGITRRTIRMFNTDNEIISHALSLWVNLIENDEIYVPVDKLKETIRSKLPNDHDAFIERIKNLSENYKNPCHKCDMPSSVPCTQCDVFDNIDEEKATT